MKEKPISNMYTGLFFQKAFDSRPVAQEWKIDDQI